MSKSALGAIIEMKKLTDDFIGKAESFVARQKAKEELLAFCSQCESMEISEKGRGDEGITYCEDCNSVEQGYIYMTESEAEKKGLI